LATTGLLFHGPWLPVQGSASAFNLDEFPTPNPEMDVHQPMVSGRIEKLDTPGGGSPRAGEQGVGAVS